MRRWRAWIVGLGLAPGSAPEAAPGQEPPGTYADAPFNQGTIFYNSARAWGRRTGSSRGAPRRYAAEGRAYRGAVTAPAPSYYAAPVPHRPTQRPWYWTGRGWPLR